MYLFGAYGKEKGSYWEVPLKTLATGIIASIVALQGGMEGVTLVIFIGLCLTLAGDLLLAINNHITQETPLSLTLMGLGLLFFMAGYFCYGFTFLLQGKELYWTRLFLGGITFLTIGGYLQFKQIDRIMKIPVLIYCLQGILLATGGFRLLITRPALGTLLIFMGSLSLYASDMIIGFDLFHKKIPKSDYWIMPTYAMGQSFIAAGVILAF